MSIKIAAECQSDFSNYRIRKVIQFALDKAGAGKKSNLSVAIITEKKIRALNKKYRGKNQSVAVLSFSFLSEPNRHFVLPKEEAYLLGEIFLSPRDISRRAKQFNSSYQGQFIHLLVHGTLHLLGFSHQTKKEAQEMEELEKKIVGGL